MSDNEYGSPLASAIATEVGGIGGTFVRFRTHGAETFHGADVVVKGLGLAARFQMFDRPMRQQIRIAQHAAHEPRLGRRLHRQRVWVHLRVEQRAGGRVRRLERAAGGDYGYC